MGEIAPIVIDGVELRVAPLGFAHDDQLVIIKPPEAIDGYRDLLATFQRSRIVEIGIARGGSVALLALLAQPELLVALELHDERVGPLDALIAERQLGDHVHLHYGTDQADRSEVARIVETEFGDEPLDLVIDDGSHLYTQTVASFEVLFPRVRPGGAYIIEDWTCDDGIRALIAGAADDPASPYHGWAQASLRGEQSSDRGQPAATAAAVGSLVGSSAAGSPVLRPMSRLGAQLVMGPATAGSGIASIAANEFWLVVWRSDEPLDRDAYTIADACPDPFGTITT